MNYSELNDNNGVTCIKEQISDWEAYLKLNEEKAKELAIDINYHDYRITKDMEKFIFNISFNRTFKKNLRGNNVTLVKEEKLEDNSIEYIGPTIGNVYSYNRNTQELIIEMNDDFFEKWKRNKYEILKEGKLYISNIGDVVQIKRLRKGLVTLQEGRTTNKNLINFIFNASKAKQITSCKYKIDKNNLLQKNLNAEQIEAVNGAINCEDLFLVQGPPGTGKTTVIAEICYQNAIRYLKTLVASQTNLAVDNALSKLIHHYKIIPLRKGNDESVEEEGIYFTEGKVIDTWIDNTIKENNKRVENKKEYLDKITKMNKESTYVFSLFKEYVDFNKENNLIEKEIENLDKSFKSKKSELLSIETAINDFSIDPSNYENKEILINLCCDKDDIGDKIVSIFNRTMQLNDDFKGISHQYESELKTINDNISSNQTIMYLIPEKINWIKSIIKKLNLDYDVKNFEYINRNPFNIKSRFFEISESICKHITEYEEEIKNIDLEYNEKLNAIEDEISNGLIIDHINMKKELLVSIYKEFIKISFSDIYNELLIDPYGVEVELIENYRKISGDVFETNNEKEKSSFVSEVEKTMRILEYHENNVIGSIIQYKHKQLLFEYSWIEQRIMCSIKELIDRTVNLKVSLQDIDTNLEMLNDYDSEVKSNKEYIINKIGKYTNRSISNSRNYSYDNVDLYFIYKKIGCLERELNERKQEETQIALSNIVNTNKWLNDMYQLLNECDLLEVCISNNIKEQTERKTNLLNKEKTIKELYDLRQLYKKLIIKSEEIANVCFDNSALLKKERDCKKVEREDSFKSQLSRMIYEFEKEAKKEIGELEKDYEAYKDANIQLNVNLKKAKIFADNQKNIQLSIHNKRKEELRNEVVMLHNTIINSIKNIIKEMEEETNNLSIKLTNNRSKIQEIEEDNLFANLLSIKKIMENMKDNFYKETNEANATRILKRYIENNAKYIRFIEEWVSSITNIDEENYSTLKQVYIDNANVVGTTCNQSGSKDFIDNYPVFDVVIVDEVSKAIPPEIVLPCLKAKKVILVGDHKQLPPMIGTETYIEIAEQMNKTQEQINHLGNSQFEQLFEYAPSNLKTMLNVQYRMHNQIMDTINQFYIEETPLICGIINVDKKREHNCHDSEVILESNHVLWFDVPNFEEHKEIKKNHSYSNKTEVECVKKILLTINNNLKINNYEKKKQVGVISFYNEQIMLLEEELYDEAFQELISNVELRIGSVDRFQGIERPVIICSFVRNNIAGDIGFAKDPRRINVAMSRAQELSIVVGCKNLFCDQNRNHKSANIYKNIYNIIDKYGGVRNALDFQ